MYHSEAADLGLLNSQKINRVERVLHLLMRFIAFAKTWVSRQLKASGCKIGNR